MSKRIALTASSCRPDAVMVLAASVCLRAIQAWPRNLPALVAEHLWSTLPGAALGCFLALSACERLPNGYPRVFNTLVKLEIIM